MTDLRNKLEARLASGHEDALLRFTLGSLCLKEGAFEQAAEHLARAVDLDASSSAAWKLHGKARLSLDEHTGAAEAWRSGLATAEARGDLQAAKEMNVFSGHLKAQSKAGESGA